MTPCKNYLAETKPPTGFFARHAVSPSTGGNIPPTNVRYWPSGWYFVLTGRGGKTIASGSFGNRSAALAARRSNEFGRESVNEHADGTIDRAFIHA